MKILKKIRYALEYAVVLLAAPLLRVMPHDFFVSFARGLGRFAYGLGVARAKAMKNLDLAFPEKSKKEKEDILKEAYRCFGESILEIARMPVTDLDKLSDRFVIEDAHVLKAALDAGKGVLAMSAHYGSWEMMAAALKHKGYPMRLAWGTLSNSWVDQLFIDFRKSVNLEGIRIGNLRKLIKSLKANEVVAIVQDQDGDKWGTFTQFFGHYASTWPMTEILAKRSGAAIVFGVPMRSAGGRYRLRVHAIPSAPEGLNAIQAQAWRLQEFNRLLEAVIRQDPTQWLWMHHRWEAQPFHRLTGENRRRAEAGEIAFDTVDQIWKDKAGLAVDTPEWK